MNLTEKKDYIQSIYHKALGAGLCSTQKEWAALLDVDRSGLSSAMNGSEKALTDSLVTKVKFWAQANGLGSPQPERGTDIVIPAETATFYLNLSESLRNMSETVRMQQELIRQLQDGAHITPEKKKIG